MLSIIKEEWKNIIESELKIKAGSTEIESLVIGTPPKQEMGDIAFPMFTYSKLLRLSPAQIANDIKTSLEQRSDLPKGSLLTAGPYLNVKLDTASLVNDLIKEVANDDYGKNEINKGKKVMIEFSCPNTNKPLHLGHMRNDSLGMAVAELLKYSSAEVKKVNLINNRGVHICKSMCAYQMFSNGETPESCGEKGDHFVGRYYVKYAQWEKEFVKNALEAAGEVSSEEAEEIKKNAEVEANRLPQEMLVKWENGDEEVIALWNKMNNWTLDGLAESYTNMNINFDKYYYESNTYKLGKSEVLKGVEKNVYFKAEDGSIQIDLEPIGLDKKILLRKDGTSIYMTQDLGTAVNRHEDYPFDSMIYVVASEQQYHFKVLFYALKQLGYKWAEELHHLSYGMVNLPSGRMKSREGTVVDADDLLENLTSLAKNEIISKERESVLDDVDEVSRKIALAALNYYLLQVTPSKDMIFNPDESIAFSGNTGPYLQYMGARISSMLSKYTAKEGIEFDGSLLVVEDEKLLIKLIASFPDVVVKAVKNYDPSEICTFLYDLSKTFSHYYHDNQILKAETDELILARVELSKMVLKVLQSAFKIVQIPFLNAM